MSPISQRFAIPRSKDDFEKLCRDILRLQWSRPGIEIYGKSGEGQEGVDLLDLSGQDPLVAGQCKLKEEHKSLPPAEIEAEVNKAKRFQLPLGKYAILTTGKVSVHAQRKVRQLNQIHKAQGLFEIELYAWENICELIQQYTEVHEAHYGEIGTGRGFRIEQSVVRVEQNLATLVSRSDGDEIDKLINEARDAINRHDYQIATLLLNRIEQQNDHRLSNHQRFRVTTNHGFAILGQGKPKRAAKYFLDALVLEPDDEGARTNEVLAYYLTGDSATAYSKAEPLRPVYPASSRLAAYWILTAPDKKSTKDLERDLSSILLTDVQVRTALASKALSRQEIELAEVHAKAALGSDPPHGHPHLVAAQVNVARIVNHETGRGGSNIARADLIRQGEHHVREAIRLAGAEKDAQTQSEAHVLLVDLLLMDGRKEEATDEAREAYKLAPDNIQVLLAQSQTQFANDQIGEAIGALERAYAIESRADVAFSYGNALFTRSRGNDLDVAVKVLVAIDLTTVVPNMRPAIATQTLRSLIKREDWKEGYSYLDRSEAYLAAETVSSLRGYLAHYQGVPEEAERRALEAQSLVSPATTLDAKIFLARLFMLIGRSADALPLFQRSL